ncbi:hypothetical protein [Paraburkholderia rhizosphaerae]|nr:hypothetical protein [Paraburkholderia rhizosphaerae]
MISSAVLTLTACTLLPQPTHYVTETMPEYDTAVSARVRIKSGNDNQTASYWKNASCYTSPYGDNSNHVRINDSGFFARYKYSSTSITIGMPQSPREWMRPDGLKFKDLITEHVVEGNKPITLKMSDSGGEGGRYGWWSCSPSAITFTPKPGEDYDAFMVVELARRQCWISVRRINGKGMDEPVSLARASECPTPKATAQSSPVRSEH